MPRKHHSPSAVTLGTLCERKWAYEKIAHVRGKEYTWEEIERLWPGLGPLQRRDLAGARSRALGTAGHAVLESWYRGAQPAWETVPGGLALQGAHHLPGPSACVWARVEDYVGTVPYTYRYQKDGAWVEERARVIVLDGIKFLGKKDLRAQCLPAEQIRLGLGHLSYTVPVTFDYKFVGSFAQKTTRSGERYCSVKTPAELQTDAAACVYALDDMRETGLDWAPMRWVYFRTKDAPAAQAVDFVITRAQAEDTAARLVKVARRLDLITSVDDATPNTDACEAFGGCPHSPARGGTCTAKKIPAVYSDEDPASPYGENMTAPAMTKDALEAKIAAGQELSPLEQRVYALMAGVPTGAPATPAAPAGANGPAPGAALAAAMNVPVASLPGAPAGLPTPASAPVPAPVEVTGPAVANTPEPTKPRKAKAVPLAETLPKVDAVVQVPQGIRVTVTLEGGLAEVARILAAAAGG